MSIESKNNYELNENKNTKKEVNENLIKELSKISLEEWKKLQKELENTEKEKWKEIAVNIKPFSSWHKISQAEIKISTELPKDIDYSNPEHIKKTTQIALLKQARKLKEEEVA